MEHTGNPALIEEEVLLQGHGLQSSLKNVTTCLKAFGNTAKLTRNIKKHS